MPKSREAGTLYTKGQVTLMIKIILYLQYHTCRHCKKEIMNLFISDFFGIEIIINYL